MRFRSRIGFLAFMTMSVGLSVVAACGDDDDDSAGPADTTPDGSTTPDSSSPRDSSPTSEDSSPTGEPDSGPLSPIADKAVTAMTTPVTIDVLANDALGAAEVASVTTPQHGTASIAAGKIVYTPADGYSGDDAFEYVVHEGGREGRARVEVNVLAQPGTVVHGRLYVAESNDEISWADINAAGDRVGRYEKGADKDKLVLVTKAGEKTIIVPPGPAADQLVRGLADDGTVLAQYLHETRFQFIGFTWKAGAVDRTCDLGDGLGDCTLERMKPDGTIVGTAYDYTLYTGFVWPPGQDRVPLTLDGYASTYAYAINASGVIVGDGDDSSDGYSGPQRCFRGTPEIADGGAGPIASGLTVLPFESGDPHFVFCRGINAAGLIVGAVKALSDTDPTKPRSESDRIKAALWDPQKGFAYVRIPFPRPTATSWRIEQLYGVNADGVIVGTYQDATPASTPATDPIRVTRGVTLTPVEALPGTSFADSTFDHVDGPI